MYEQEKGEAPVIRCFARLKDEECGILDLGVKPTPEMCAKCSFRKPKKEVTNGKTYLKKSEIKPLGKPGRKRIEKRINNKQKKPELDYYTAHPQPYCESCIYSGRSSGFKQYICLYITKTGKRRGCDSSQCKEAGVWKPYSLMGQPLSGWQKARESGLKKFRGEEEDEDESIPRISDEDLLAEAKRLAAMIAAGGRDDVDQP